jgi:hypothetical protein
MYQKFVSKRNVFDTTRLAFVSPVYSPLEPGYGKGSVDEENARES